MDSTKFAQYEAKAPNASSNTGSALDACFNKTFETAVSHTGASRKQDSNVLQDRRQPVSKETLIDVDRQKDAERSGKHHNDATDKHSWKAAVVAGDDKDTIALVTTQDCSTGHPFPFGDIYKENFSSSTGTELVDCRTKKETGAYPVQDIRGAVARDGSSPRVYENNSSHSIFWKFEKVISHRKLTNKRGKWCCTDGCDLRACALWKGFSQAAPPQSCYVCLDCQEVYFGGWPAPNSLRGKGYMSHEMIDVIAERCSKQENPEMPQPCTGDCLGPAIE